MMLYSGEKMDTNRKKFMSKSEISDFSLDVINSEKETSENKGNIDDGNGFIWSDSLFNHNTPNTDGSEEVTNKASSARCFFPRNLGVNDCQDPAHESSGIGDVIPEFYSKLNVFDRNESDSGIFTQASKRNILQEPYGDTKNFVFHPATEDHAVNSFIGQYFYEDASFANSTPFSYQGNDFSCDVENQFTAYQPTDSKDVEKLVYMNKSILSDGNDVQEKNLPYANKNWNNSVFSGRQVNACTYFWQHYEDSNAPLYGKDDLPIPTSEPSIPNVNFAQNAMFYEWNSSLEDEDKGYSQLSTDNASVNDCVSENPPITPIDTIPSCIIRLTKKFLLSCANEPLSWVFPEDLRRFVHTGVLPLKQMTPEPPCPPPEICRTMDHIYFYECLNAYSWNLKKANSNSSQKSRKLK